MLFTSCEAALRDSWLLIAKPAISAVDRDDPYRPDVPFALAHFVDQDGNRVGAGRAYKTYGRPQPALSVLLFKFRGPC